MDLKYKPYNGEVVGQLSGLIRIRDDIHVKSCGCFVTGKRPDREHEFL